MENNDFVLYVLILVLFLLMCIPRKENFKNLNRKKISNLNYYKGYPEKGMYVKDLKRVENFCKKKILQNKRVKNRTIVFDFDDTLVYTRPYNPFEINVVEYTKNREPIFYLPPIEQMCNVARLAKKNGYVIIIITARPPTSEKATIANLNAYNIPYDLVYCDKYKGTNIKFKQQLREKLSKQCNIIMTIGDQWWDVENPGKECIGIKLPSPKEKNVFIVRE